MAVLHVDHYQNREHDGCLQDYRACEGKLQEDERSYCIFLSVNYASACSYRSDFPCIGNIAFSGTSKIICISIKAYSSLNQASASSFEGSLCALKALTSLKSPPAGAIFLESSAFCCSTGSHCVSADLLVLGEGSSLPRVISNK